jgi:hypothetical protein
MGVYRVPGTLKTKDLRIFVTVVQTVLSVII